MPMQLCFVFVLRQEVGGAVRNGQGEVNGGQHGIEKTNLRKPKETKSHEHSKEKQQYG